MLHHFNNNTGFCDWLTDSHDWSVGMYQNVQYVFQIVREIKIL